MIICVGEILADMVGKIQNGELAFVPKIGGAPFNVACCLQKLGTDTTFVGSVGNDFIGRELLKKAQEYDFYKTVIDVKDDKNTTLAFVSIDEFGERSFSFYRKNTADAYLPLIDDEIIKSASIVHIGSLMLSSESGRDYAKELIERAHANGKKVSFDVNFRTDIFASEQEAVSTYKSIIEKVDILKFSSDEVDLFGQAYVQSLSAELICITEGAKGSRAYYHGKTFDAPTIKVDCLDSTGAGDSFWGCVLHFYDSAISKGIEFNIEKTLIYANVCGALNTLRHGAVDGLPDMKTITAFVN